MTDSVNYYTKKEIDQKLLEKINKEELDSAYLSLINNKLSITDKCITNSKLDSSIKSLEIPEPTKATNNKLATELAAATLLDKKIKKEELFSINSSGYSSWKSTILEKL